MLAKVFGIMSLISLVFAIFTGRLPELGTAILDGAGNAVEVSLSLLGMMCFWSGLMEVFRETGMMQKLSKILHPLLRIFFPEAAKTGEGMEEISANVSANLLGIGNAATPFAIAAMEKLQKHNPTPERASGEEITLAVLNTASVTLLPSTLFSLRRTAGSANPYAILFPVWIVSFCTAGTVLLLSRILSHTVGKGKKP